MFLGNLPLPLREAALPLALLVIWAVLLFGGFAFGGSGAGTSRRMPTWTRLGSSLALVALSWLDYALTRELPVAGYALLIALGISFGFLGDLCLAGVLPVLSQPVAGGMLAFGLGHIAYLLAIFRVGNQLLLAAPLPRFGMLASWIALGLAGWYLVVLAGDLIWLTGATRPDADRDQCRSRINDCRPPPPLHSTLVGRATGPAAVVGAVHADEEVSCT